MDGHIESKDRLIFDPKMKSRQTAPGFRKNNTAGVVCRGSDCFIAGDWLTRKVVIIRKMYNRCDLPATFLTDTI